LETWGEIPAGTKESRRGTEIHDLAERIFQDKGYETISKGVEFDLQDPNNPRHTLKVSGTLDAYSEAQQAVADLKSGSHVRPGNLMQAGLYAMGMKALGKPVQNARIFAATDPAHKAAMNSKDPVQQMRALNEMIGGKPSAETPMTPEFEKFVTEQAFASRRTEITAHQIAPKVARTLRKMLKGQAMPEEYAQRMDLVDKAIRGTNLDIETPQLNFTGQFPSAGTSGSVEPGQVDTWMEAIQYGPRPSAPNEVMPEYSAKAGTAWGELRNMAFEARTPEARQAVANMAASMGFGMGSTGSRTPVGNAGNAGGSGIPPIVPPVAPGIPDPGQQGANMNGAAQSLGSNQPQPSYGNNKARLTNYDEALLTKTGGATGLVHQAAESYNVLIQRMNQFGGQLTQGGKSVQLHGEAAKKAAEEWAGIKEMAKAVSGKAQTAESAVRFLARRRGALSSEGGPDATAFTAGVTDLMEGQGMGELGARKQLANIGMDDLEEAAQVSFGDQKPKGIRGKALGGIGKLYNRATSNLNPWLLFRLRQVYGYTISPLMQGVNSYAEEQMAGLQAATYAGAPVQMGSAAGGVLSMQAGMKGIQTQLGEQAYATWQPMLTGIQQGLGAQGGNWTQAAATHLPALGAGYAAWSILRGAGPQASIPAGLITGILAEYAGAKSWLSSPERMRQENESMMGKSPEEQRRLAEKYVAAEKSTSANVNTAEAGHNWYTGLFGLIGHEAGLVPQVLTGKLGVGEAIKSTGQWVTAGETPQTLSFGIAKTPGTAKPAFAQSVDERLAQIPVLEQQYKLTGQDKGLSLKNWADKISHNLSIEDTTSVLKALASLQQQMPGIDFSNQATQDKWQSTIERAVGQSFATGVGVDQVVGGLMGGAAAIGYGAYSSGSQDIVRQFMGPTSNPMQQQVISQSMGIAGAYQKFVPSSQLRKLAEGPLASLLTGTKRIRQGISGAAEEYTEAPTPEMAQYALSKALGVESPADYTRMVQGMGHPEYSTVELSTGMQYGTSQPWTPRNISDIPARFRVQGTPTTMRQGAHMLPVPAQQQAMSYWDVQDAQIQENYNYGMQTAGISAAQIAYTRQNTGEQWKIQDQMKNLSRDQQRQSDQMGMEAARKRFQNMMEEHALQRKIFEENVKFQRESMQIEHEHHQTKVEWAREDMQTERQRFETQSGWQMEDVNRAIRFSSGREKTDLMRQRERMVQQTEWSRQDQTKQATRFETETGWSEEDYQRQLEQFDKMNDLQRQLMDMQARHAAEMMGLEEAQYAQQTKNREEMWKLQDDLENKQREAQKKSWEFQEASLGAQIAHMKSQKEFDDFFLQFQRDAEQGQTQMTEYMGKGANALTTIAEQVDRLVKDAEKLRDILDDIDNNNNNDGSNDGSSGGSGGSTDPTHPDGKPPLNSIVIHAPISVTGVQDPEAVARVVKSKLGDWVRELSYEESWRN
jgi:hypothetical protein